MTNKFDYSKMQRDFYNNCSTIADFKRIVGNYEGNEAFDWEKYLKPVGDIALDFGCGMGRMITRLARQFKRIDGVDLSLPMINYCRTNHPSSNFWVATGQDCPAFEQHYDFVYSVLCFQHICSRTIRDHLLGSIAACMKIGGKIVIQMGYCDILPSCSINHALYPEDKFEARGTNSGCDCIITAADIPLLVADFSQYYHSVKITISDENYPKVGFENYWCEKMIFIEGIK